ncbi:MAG: PilW family protein [Wenzhouxiangella sp.]
MTTIYRDFSYTVSNQKRARGFTLVELMVALALSIFLIGGVLLMYLSGRSASVDAEQLARIQENVRFASDYLIRDIRNAGFRDEAFLRAGHERQIRQQYANIINGNTLQIRYAGRGHCAENFDEFRLVENEYFLQGGELKCRGRFVEQTASGATQINAQAWSDSIGLVSGLSGLNFSIICPPGVVGGCTCDLETDPVDSCIGVTIGLEFEGLRSVDGSAGREDRIVEIEAAFRNAILSRVNAFGA